MTFIAAAGLDAENNSEEICAAICAAERAYLIDSNSSEGTGMQIQAIDLEGLKV